MKKIFLTLIIILELLIIKIPEYNELNNIAIIEEISVIKQNNKYHITFKEIIPIKENNSLTYKYKEHKIKTNDLTKSLDEISKTTKKKLYLSKTKSLTTNLTYSNKIIKLYKIKPKIINHPSNYKSILEQTYPLSS